MKVGIVLNRVSFEEKSIIKALKARNHEVIQLNNQRIYLTLQNQNLDENIKDLDIILQRSLSLTRGLYSSAIYEFMGKKVINTYESTRICGDKLLTTLKLVENGINTPLTSVAFTKDSAIDSIENDIEYPAIIKPTFGSWGRLIAKIDNKNMASAILEDRETLGNIFQKVFYLQRYVSPEERAKDSPTDIRVFYLNGECIGAMGRYQVGDDFRSNIAIGGRGENYEINDEVENICKKIANAVGGEMLGIDLMELKDGYTCLEVNGTPQFKGIASSTGINIGEKIVEYLEEKYC